MRFVDRHLNSGAVNFACRSMNKPLGAGLPRCFQHIQGTEHVCVDVGLSCGVGMGYRDQGREMKDDLVPRYEATDESCVTNVTTHQVDVLSDLIREIVQPAMAIEGIVLRQSSNVGSRG